MGKRSGNLVQNLIDELNHSLLDTSRTVSLSKTEATQQMTRLIKKAYFNCPEAKRNDFYRDLSLLLHPDKLIGAHPSSTLVRYLNEQDLVNEPQKILNELHNELASETISSFLREVFRSPANSSAVLRRRIQDNPFFLNLERYIEPFKTGSQLLLLVLILCFSIPLIIIATCCTLVRFIIDTANSLVNSLLNKVTNNFYEQLIEDNKEINFPKYKKQFLNASRKELIAEAQKDNNQLLVNTLATIDDEQLFEYILNINFNKKFPDGNGDLKHIEKELSDEIKRTTRIFSEGRIKSAFWAFYRSITDTSNNRINQLMQFVVAPFLLGAVLSGELIVLVIRGISVVEEFMELASYYLSLVVLNIPLYIYDLSVFIMASFEGKNIHPESDVEATHIKTPLCLLYDPVATPNPVSPEEPPFHADAPVFGCKGANKGNFASEHASENSLSL